MCIRDSLYYLPRTANWVQDEIGRLLYIVNRGDDPKIVDVKENMSYDWILDPPGAIAENAFEMTIVEQGELNVNRDLAAIVEGEVEKGGIHTIFPTPSNTGVYIDIRAQTDITEVLVAVANVAGDYIRTLYEGSLAQGGHRFFWDGRNEAGNAVAAGSYIAIFYIADSGKTIVNTSPSNEEPNEGWWSQFVDGFIIGVTLGISLILDAVFSDTNTGFDSFEITGVPSNRSKFYLSGQFRWVCFTYFSEKLNIESRPSTASKRRVYFWHVDDEDPPEFSITTFLGIANLPNWATGINIYVSEEPTGLEEYTKAIETGLDFRRLGVLVINDGTLCLLYTSPSPRDRTRSRMPSSA